MKFRSKLEERVRGLLSKAFKYEDVKLPYVSEHVYTTDFSNKARKLIIEVKGRFRPGEPRKYIDVIRCNPEYELVFLFQDPAKPMPGARVRKKCGTKQTHGQWAKKNGFRYYRADDVVEEDL